MFWKVTKIVNRWSQVVFRSEFFKNSLRFPLFWRILMENLMLTKIMFVLSACPERTKTVLVLSGLSDGSGILVEIIMNSEWRLGSKNSWFRLLVYQWIFRFEIWLIFFFWIHSRLCERPCLHMFVFTSFY